MSLPLLHAGRTNPGLSAALDLRFALDKSLTAYRGPTPSFSRASTGTFFNSSGVLTSAAVNAPRFNHVYSGGSWVSRGLLVEEQRTNNFTNSNDFSSGWSQANAATTSSATLSPDGTNTGIKLYPTATTTDTRIYRSGALNCISVFAKAAEKSFVFMYDYNGTNACWFDLANGAIGTNSTGYPATIVNCGNGWYRISLHSPSANFSWFQIGVSDANGSKSSTASGTNGILIWGAQSETGSFPTSYIPTTSASTTRSADVCQITGTNFSGFYNANEGSVCFEGDSYGSNASNDNYFLICSDGSTFNNAAPFVFSSGSLNSLRHRVRAGAVDIFNITTSEQLARSTQIKLAQGYKSGDSVILANGSIIDSRTDSFSTSGISTFYIGHAHSGLAQLNGHIARLRYYNKRLPNATLQQLSDPDPTLNLQFDLNKTLTPVAGPAPSFSRASTGTYFNASGVLTSASINTPRFDHVYSGGQWVSRGLLLEEQRTNFAQRSDDFANAYWAVNGTGGLTVTSNSSVSPDGTTTADTIAGAPATGGAWIRSSMSTAIVSGAYTFSVFIKKTSGATVFPMLLIEGPFGNSAIFCDTNTGQVYDRPGVVGLAKSSQDCGLYWRFSTTLNNTGSGNARFYIYPAITVDFVNTSNALTGSQIYWGAQFEAGAFPTSYMGTTSSSVTRSADVCQITGTSFGWMWNQGEGSVVAEFDTNAPSVPLATSGFNTQIFAARNSSNNQRIYLGTENFGGRRFYIDDGAGSSSVISPGALIGNGVINKASVAWKTNDMAASFDGASVLTDNSQIIPTGITQIDFGKSPANTNYLCGHIAKLIYYPARLTNTKLQQLST